MLGCIVEETGDAVRLSGFARAANNLALDEAIVRTAPSTPVLRCWQNPECVVVGRGQRIEREVDQARTQRDGVEVLRRCSGGGTVYHDDGNLNISLVLPARATKPLRVLTKLLLAALRGFALRPEASDRGIFLHGSKLAGFAALHAAGATLVHASLLVRTPAERVARYLTPAPTDPHPLDSHRSPVAALLEHGVHVTPGEVALAVRTAAAEQFGPATNRTANPAELTARQRLLHTRYGCSTWHHSGQTRQDDQEKEGAWTPRRVSICTG